MKVADPRNASHKKYIQELTRSNETGVCIFCDPRFTRNKFFLKKIGEWEVRHQQYGKKDREGKSPKLCLAIYPTRHVTDALSLTANDFSDIKKIARWIKNAHKVKGGTLCMRFGDSRWSGATIAHVHFQYIVPRVKHGRAIPLDWPVG